MMPLDEAQSLLAEMIVAGDLPGGALVWLAQKGGPGSGFRGHAGRPGKRGGSQRADEAPSDPPPTARVGLRPHWESIRFAVEAVMTDTWSAQHDMHSWVAKRISILDQLSQDELADLMIYSATHNVSPFGFDSREDDPFDPTVGKRLLDENGDMLNDPKTSRGWQDWPRGGQYASRLDEDHAQKVADALFPIAVQYPREANGKHKYNAMEESVVFDKGAADALSALAGFGPTSAFRKALTNKMEAAGVTTWVTSELSGDIDKDIEYAVARWTVTAGTAEGVWLNAAVAKVFGGQETTTGYWGSSSLGLIMKDVSPEWQNVAKELYRRTQDFYDKRDAAHPKKAPTTEFAAFRGMKHPHAVAAPLDSWSLSEASARKFMWKSEEGVVAKRTIPRKQVLMSWEALAGIWPDEKELNGKKEVTAINFDFDPKAVLR